MAPYVLGVTLLFVILVGVTLRFIFWVERVFRRRRGARRQPDRALASSSVAGPRPASHGPSGKPSIQATLAPGAALKPAPPCPHAAEKSRDRLPSHMQAPKSSATLQPAGAKWTPPPQPHRAAEAPAVHQPPPPLPAVKPVGPLEIVAPSIKGTLAPAAGAHANSSAPPASAAARSAAAASPPAHATNSHGPSVKATLVPGAVLRPPQPKPAPPAPSREPLPSGFQAPKMATTLQPAGAKWTAPARAIPADAEPPAPPTRATAQKPAAPTGPLEIVPPSLKGTLAPGATISPPKPPQTFKPASAAPKDGIAVSFAPPSVASTLPPGAKMSASTQQGARSLSSAASISSPLWRAAPTPRSGPPSWAIDAVKTSLPFRVRRPATRLVGATAKEVLLISKARRKLRVLGQIFKSKVLGR